MRSTIRHAALAFAAGVLIALACDVVLQFLSTSVRLTGGVTAPWWANVAAHGSWIAVGAFVWLAAPLASATLESLAPDANASRRTVWGVMGTAFLFIPPLFQAAQLVILAVYLTVSGTWGSEGRIFISGAYYGMVLLTITPWMAAGAILRASAAHLIDLP